MHSDYARQMKFRRIDDSVVIFVLGCVSLFNAKSIVLRLY